MIRSAGARVQAFTTGAIRRAVAACADPRVVRRILVAFGAVGLLGVVALSATLPRRISEIVFRCPKKEVCGIAAGRIVTPMANVQPARDGTVCQFPCDSHRRGGFPGHVDHAIAELVPMSGPLPAFITPSAAHLLPKTFAQWPLFPLVSVHAVNLTNAHGYFNH